MTSRKKLRAQRLAGEAIRSGKLVRGLCEVCGTAKNVEAHHGDYDKPLDVRWLCHSDHFKHHAQNDWKLYRLGVYVASRASVPERGEMWRRLRSSGVRINSSWIDEDGVGQTEDFSELWSRIESEVRQSQRLILYAEPGDFPLKGALVEVGIALAFEVPVIAVLPGVELEPRTMRPVGSWMCHPLVRIASTIEQALVMEVS